MVTGLNAEGIYVSVNAAAHRGQGQATACPVELLLREVLESAHTLDEAIALVSKRPVLVPDFYLVGDGKTGESAVIERSPDAHRGAAHARTVHRAGQPRAVPRRSPATRRTSG